MKKSEKKLRKFGFEKDSFLPEVFLELKIKVGYIRFSTDSNRFVILNNKKELISINENWLPFTSIKDLKKQVKEKTGIVLKKDKPVTKKELKKYGWVEGYISAVECEDFYLHKDFYDNGVFYDFIDSKITADGAGFTPCPTMSQLKSYVLEHTGKKMQKVNKSIVDDKNHVATILIKKAVKRNESAFNEFHKGIEKIETELKDIATDDSPKDQSGNGNDLAQKTELPKRWEDIDLNDGMQVDWIDECSKIETSLISSLQEKADKNILPKGLGYPMLATCQLLLLRDIYRQGWKPDWNDNNTKKCIGAYQDKIYKTYYTNEVQIWSFQDKKTRDLFLENFEPLLKEHYKLYD